MRWHQSVCTGLEGEISVFKSSSKGLHGALELASSAVMLLPAAADSTEPQDELQGSLVYCAKAWVFKVLIVLRAVCLAKHA